MTNELTIYNTLSRRKEKFKPINPPFVGLYACGPTVYGDAHLGHARQAITFDVVFRTLLYMDFKVRYVRNITDVGHLEDDADEGEDKVLKKARLESLEPMEVVQLYMNRYHENMRQLNVLPPSIEPRASGHMIEQQELIRKIMDAGYAYEVNGSVYFDVSRYNQDHPYGILSGRNAFQYKAPGRAVGKKECAGFRPLEKSGAGTYNALEIPVERWFPGLAS
jgi:cysteinyl-tRNA synthetase